jgi:hypothetical protein
VPGDDLALELLDDRRQPVRRRVDVGLSIWYGSPVSTTFVASPTRVMIVFTSCGVRFCASSTMMNWFGIERPRMYVSGSISM